MTAARILTGAVALTAASGLAAADLASFNDLIVDTQYMVGDSFTSDGVGFEILDFTPGYMFSSHAQVHDNQMAGGDGLDLELNNVRLELTVPFSSVPSVTVFFGQFGGQNNIFVNGEMIETGTFYDVDGMTVGGATIDVADLGGGPSLGRLTVTGDIESFGISGQELWVDNLRFAIPAPGALPLIAGGLLVAARRRR